MVLERAFSKKSGGFTSKSPFYLMRGKVPLAGMVRNGDSLAEKITMALFGPLTIIRYIFTPNFFLAQARPLIHDAEFLLKLQRGELIKTECNRCNKCFVEMDRDGVKCVL